VMPSLWVKTRSNNGAATTEAMMPESSKDAPIIPAVVSEYPTGSWWRAIVELDGYTKSRERELTSHSADNTLNVLVAPTKTPKRAVTMTKSRRSWKVMDASCGTDQPKTARQRDFRD